MRALIFIEKGKQFLSRDDKDWKNNSSIIPELYPILQIESYWPMRKSARNGYSSFL